MIQVAVWERFITTLPFSGEREYNISRFEAKETNMSQAKVDRYKQEKANREQIIKKERLVRRLEYAVGILVLCLIIVWCGVSVYQKAEEKRASQVETAELDNTAISDYMASLNETEAE